MPDILRIKRRAVGGAAGPPASLAAAEIAFNEQDRVLYYGLGNSGGLATSIISIAGSGAYLPITGGILTGKLTTILSGTAAAGFNLPHGAAPTTPVNGDFWTTTIGVFARLNGITVGPFASTVSPLFTGNPQAPTPAVADDSISIATTAYVVRAVGDAPNKLITLTGDVTGTGTSGVASTVVRFQGRPFAATLPTINQVIQWDGTNWVPATVPPTTTNPNVGTFQGITVNNQGLVTAAANLSYVTGGPYLPLTGGALSGGLSFGSATVGTSDVTRHISLHGAGYGLSISAGRQNYVVGAGGTHIFVIAGTGDVASISATQVYSPIPVRIKSTATTADLTIGTTAGTARVYNTYTDASNADWAYMGDWSSGVARYGSDKIGTGVVYDVNLVRGGTEYLRLGAATLTASVGMNFGARVGASATDLSQHIILHTNGYGFGITAARFNYGTPAGGSHRFMIGTADFFSVLNTGIFIHGATTGSLGLAVPATVSGTITFPSGTTNFTATGGAGRVVKQTTTGGALTVAALTAYELDNTPALPVLLGTATIAAAVRGVCVMGNYAYTLNQSTTGLIDVLEIFDITNPAAPVKVSGLILPNQGLGNPIVAGNICYIGINSTTVGLQIIDVSNPKVPGVLRAMNPAGQGVQYIALSGAHLYMGFSVTSNFFRVVDVSDAANPLIKGNVTMAGASGTRSIVLQGKYAFVGTGQAVAATGGLYIYDVSDPNNLGLVVTVNTASAVNGLAVAGKYLYAAGPSTALGLWVYNIDDLTAPVLVTTFTTSTVANIGSNPIVFGNYLFLYGATAIQIINITDPAAPSSLGTVNPVAPAFGGVLRGERLYITANAQLRIYDTMGVDAPTLRTGSINTDHLFVDAQANFAGDIFAMRSLVVGQAGIFSRGPIWTDASDAAIPISAVFGTGLVCFGGDNATYPALKRSTTVLQTRLGDDSAYAGFEAATLTAGGASITSAGTLFEAISSNTTVYNSASAASGTRIGIVNSDSATDGNFSRIVFNTYNTTPNLTSMGALTCIFLEHLAGSENVAFTFQSRFNGPYSERARLQGNNFGVGSDFSTKAPQAILHVGATAATARSYNLFTDVSNAQWAYMGDWGGAANVARYGTDKIGSGVVGNVQFLVGGVDQLNYGITTAGWWTAASPLMVLSQIRSSGAASGMFFLDRVTNVPWAWYSSSGVAYLYNGTTNVLNCTLAGAITIPGTLTVTGIASGPTAAAGTNTTQLATTAFVEEAVGTAVSISDTAPSTPLAGGLWWDSISGQLYIRFNDGTSAQWVVANNQVGPAGQTGPQGPQGIQGIQGPDWTAGAGLLLNTATNPDTIYVDQTYLNAYYLSLNGGTMNGGINFGARLATSATDLTRHIMLWNTGFGFNITANTLNYVSAGNHNFLTGSTVTHSHNLSGSYLYRGAGVKMTDSVLSADLHVGVTSGTTRVYNNYTDTLNGEWAYMGDWSSDVARYGTDANGTFSGLARNIQILIGGTDKLNYGVTNAFAWTFSSAVEFATNFGSTEGAVLNVDAVSGLTAAKLGSDRAVYIIQSNPTIGFNAYWNTSWLYGKGAVAGYAGTHLFNTTTGEAFFQATTATGAANASASTMDNVFGVNRNGLVTLGRSALFTSAFPALKRNAATLEVRLADDTAYTTITTAGATFTGGVSFGSIVAPGGVTDLSRHIILWNPGYGFNVTGSRLNYVAASHRMIVGTTDIVSVLGIGVGILNATPQVNLHVGSTAATARTYNQYTDASNGSWAYMGDWGGTANVARYGTDKIGSGVVGNLQFFVGGVDQLNYGLSSAGNWRFASPIQVITTTRQAYFGSTGANFAEIGLDNAVTGQQARVAFMEAGVTKWLIGNDAANAFYVYDAVFGGYALAVSAAGQLNLGENAAQNIQMPKTGLICFTGTTSAFPALKRNSTTLEHRLADDSAWAPVAASAMIISGANGQSMTCQQLTESTVVVAFATTTTTIQIPNRALIIGVTVLVQTTIPTATSFSVGVSGATTRYGSGITTVSGSSFNGSPIDSVIFYASPTSITITPNLTPANNTGRVRVTIHYISMTAPSS